jgi:AbrB family looped-hinge helix DNA binding protein
MQTTFVDNAKVMSKGQVTIPKDVRKVLGVSEGDRISFVVEGNTVRIVNAAVFAMQMLQSNLQGESKKSRLESENDIIQLVKDVRVKGKNDNSD